MILGNKCDLKQGAYKENERVNFLEAKVYKSCAMYSSVVPYDYMTLMSYNHMGQQMNTLANSN